jgi:hypothetical protein
LAALPVGSQYRHGNLETFIGTVAIAGMDLLVVIEPARYVFDAGGHFDVVVHAAGSCSLLSDGSPATAGEDFGETFGAEHADFVFATPLIDFLNARRAGATFNNAADAVGKLNESSNVVRRTVQLGDFPQPAAWGITHSAGA